MSDQETLEALLRGAIYAIPVAVFFLLLFLVARRSRNRAALRAPQRAADLAPDAASMPAAVEASKPRDVQAELTETNRSIESALAAKDNGSLAALYLDLAREYGHLGDVAAQMAALRSAAGYGALHGPRSAHAAARMELAEAAYRSGDLTTACEQWQLARSAYFEDGQLAQHAQVEKRMRDNGCPTDWVLTDF